MKQDFTGILKDFIASPLLKVAPPKKADVLFIRFLIVSALGIMLLFVYWLLRPEHMGNGILFWALTIALLFKLSKMLMEWYYYWSPTVPFRPELKTKFTVDILTTACPGEPKEMIIRTLRAMQNITYPHTSYLCDEGDDPVLKKVCDELGVIHVTRKEKKNAKAGNINNALRQATGDICVILDPDHVPLPQFVDRVLPYFENEQIGFVQCVQGYYNQEESFVARGAAEQTYHFYGPMMMSMNTYGTAQAIGANCTFRRKALDSIGGHAPGLAEDMHTSMQLHAKGWKSVYIPEMLTRGLVPATLSSYYKQQLKWSRGTFELLFRVFPTLYKNFTWKQRLHYFTIPVYYLFGLINFLDILIPVLSLLLAVVPWEVEIASFAVTFTPLCVLGIVIRLFAQRWLLHESEHGFHFAGGVLRNATWWIFSVGLIYSILNINVPYIPTPKEDRHLNYWRLCIPNIVVIVICFVVIIYGLSIDYTPYSVAMALYSFITIAILSFATIMSQQRMLLTMKSFFRKMPQLLIVYAPIYSGINSFRKLIYGTFRNAPLTIMLGLSLFYVSYNNKTTEVDAKFRKKEIGGFYSGIALDSAGLSNIKDYRERFGRDLSVVALDAEWQTEFPSGMMRNIKETQSMVLLNWRVSKNVYGDISSGKYNKYLERCAAMVRLHKEPLFICFAPYFDADTTVVDSEFKKAWQHVYTFFNNLGVSNITWVWTPRYPRSEKFYPGELFVDWIGFSCLNYGVNIKSKNWSSFNELYKPYRNHLGHLKKPVMITEFGSVKGGYQKIWLKDATKDIRKKFTEIKSIVIYNNEKKNIVGSSKESESVLYVSDFHISEIDAREIFSKQNASEKPFTARPLLEHKLNYLKEKGKRKLSKFINGLPGKFSLSVNGNPYYIKGVAYNPKHDWRDGNVPLSRRQLEKDFSAIKAMGANTIRRYGSGVYDRNILNIAEEYDLKVIYGLWFDPRVDYYRDTAKVQEYIRHVEEKVMEFKDRKAILAWAVGNETWGQLKHNFAKPYLGLVRLHYVKMIEHMAQRIHEIDSTRPVISAMEHEEYQLPGEIAAFHDGAPSVDIIGINSYYEEQISKLNHVFWQFDSLRPYIVSEFGPRGYWDPKYNKTKNGVLLEQDDDEKYEWYKTQWKAYVEGYKGYNLGGFAYCWQDRMEGSYTWFGICDYKGRLKPSYYALKEAWMNEKEDNLPAFTIVTPDKIDPRRECTFVARPKTSYSKELKVEWVVLKDDYLQRVDCVEETESEFAVKIKIPTEISDYRLYMYVSDEKGNVTTASVPICVR